MRAVITSFALLAGVIIGATLAAASGGNAAPSGGSANVQHWSVNATEVIAPDATNCTKTVGYPLDGITGTATCHTYYAAVHLPDGAQINEMTVFFNDSVAANGVFLLAETPLDGSFDGSVLRYDSDGTPGETSITIPGTSDVINNATTHYRIALNLGDGVTFYSAMITYTVPDSAGAFTNGDVDCSGSVVARDQQAVLRFILGQPALSQTEPCPDLGS